MRAGQRIASRVPAATSGSNIVGAAARSDNAGINATAVARRDCDNDARRRDLALQFGGHGICQWTMRIHPEHTPATDIPCGRAIALPLSHAPFVISRITREAI